MEDVLLPGTYLKGCSHTFKIEKVMAPRKKDRCQTVGDFMSLLSQRKEYK